MIKECEICKKGIFGEVLYWVNPEINKLSENVLTFCSAFCSTLWYEKQKENVQDN